MMEIADAELRNIIGGNRYALQILGEVQEFFGPTFIVFRDEIGKTSHYECASDPHTATLKHAKITLATKTGRTGEALLHELLHLRLRALGFPLPAQPAPHGHPELHVKLGQLVNKITNIAEHLLFYDDWRRSGYSADRFVGESVQQDYDSWVKIDSNDPGSDPTWIARWYLEYFRFYAGAISAPLDKDIATKVNMVGNKVVPEFDNGCRTIRSWVDSLPHKTPRNYFPAINELLRLFELPHVATAWVVQPFSQDRQSQSLVEVDC